MYRIEEQCARPMKSPVRGEVVSWQLVICMPSGWEGHLMWTQNQPLFLLGCATVLFGAVALRPDSQCVRFHFCQATIQARSVFVMATPQQPPVACHVIGLDWPQPHGVHFKALNWAGLVEQQTAWKRMGNAWEFPP